MADNIDIKDADGATVSVSTKDIGGVEFQKVLTADPSTGAPILPASQDDVQSLATILGTLLKPTDLATLATAAKQDTAQASLAAIVSALAPLATAAGVAEVRDRLPATAHAQPLTDAQLRAAPLPLPAGAATDASLDAIANLLALIADLLPRITSNKQVAVSIEAGSLGTLSDLQRVGGQYVNGHALNSAGLAVIYNQLEVT